MVKLTPCSMGDQILVEQEFDALSIAFVCETM